MINVRVDEVFATPLTEEEKQIEEIKRLAIEAVAFKEQALANLKITINGKVFYADSEARIDIGDAIKIAEDKGTLETSWKLAEEFEGSRFAIVTLEELKEVQYLALATKAELVGVPSAESISTEEVVK